MYVTRHTASGHELHASINPALAEFDRLLQKAARPSAPSPQQKADERRLFQREPAPLSPSARGGW